ncbi:MAG: hypothetical protein IAI50_14705 [Candidatus Eremiobacteraeota bacterium]|nr:hypothetical protein [Candidatus Eremiobacteraeota bacterium]
MTNQAIESSTTTLAAFTLAAPQIDAAQAIAGAPAQTGTDIVARSTIVKVALEDWPRSFERAKAGHNDGDDRAANVARTVFAGGATAPDARLDDRSIPPRENEDSSRRRRPADPECDLAPSDPEASSANASYALDDIVRFAGEIIATHRDDMGDEPWPLSAHS